MDAEWIDPSDTVSRVGSGPAGPFPHGAADAFTANELLCPNRTAASGPEEGAEDCSFYRCLIKCRVTLAVERFPTPEPGAFGW